MGFDYANLFGWFKFPQLDLNSGHNSSLNSGNLEPQLHVPTSQEEVEVEVEVAKLVFLNRPHEIDDFESAS